jgi:hypothetical protein
MAKQEQERVIDGGTTNLPVDVRKQLQEEADKLARKIAAPSGDKITVTRRKTFKLPNGIEGPTLRVVVLDFVSYNAFYDRAFSDDEKSPPACFALGDDPRQLKPSDNSPDKQSDDCADCPNNQFGSRGKGKACGNHRLLAVVEPGDNPEAPIYLLKTSPTAVKNWDSYASGVASRFGMSPIGVTTEVLFDPAKDYPTLMFGNPLPNPDVKLHIARKEAATKRLLTEPDVSSYEPVKKPAGKRK